MKQTAQVLALWVARQIVDYREASIYRLNLDRVPVLAGCERFEWRYRSADEFVGSLDGELCYTSVVSRTGFSVPDRVRVIFQRSTDAYVGDCVTLPAYRGRGVYPCGLAALARHLRAEGKTALYLFVERDNLASIRSVRKAGFVPVAVCSVHKAWRTRRHVRFLSDDQAAANGWIVEDTA